MFMGRITGGFDGVYHFQITFPMNIFIIKVQNDELVGYLRLLV